VRSERGDRASLSPRFSLRFARSSPSAVITNGRCRSCTGAAICRGRSASRASIVASISSPMGWSGFPRTSGEHRHGRRVHHRQPFPADVPPGARPALSERARARLLWGMRHQTGAVLRMACASRLLTGWRARARSGATRGVARPDHPPTPPARGGTGGCVWSARRGAAVGRYRLQPRC
jgi:hypothetical protein